MNIQVCPSISKTGRNFQKISEIVRKDRRLGMRMIADMVGISRETVRQILRKKPPNLWKNSLTGQCPSSQRPSLQHLTFIQYGISPSRMVELDATLLIGKFSLLHTYQAIPSIDRFVDDPN